MADADDMSVKRAGPKEMIVNPTTPSKSYAEFRIGSTKVFVPSGRAGGRWVPSRFDPDADFPPGSRYPEFSRSGMTRNTAGTVGGVGVIFFAEMGKI